MSKKDKSHNLSDDLANMDSLSYQKIDLGGGESTDGDDRSYLLDVALDDEMTGKSLLDIGSFLGYFCIEASKRGAIATGIETDPSNYVNAKKIASHLNQDIEYINDDFEQTELDRKFDVILCLNVLHHLFDPVGSIRKIIKMSSGKILIEYCPVSFREIFKITKNPISAILSLFPVIYLGDKKNKVLLRSYLFSDKALQRIFNLHTELFEPVKISNSPFKGRKILEANRRRIKHLLVVAGPTSIGKSTFCRKFLGGEIDLNEEINSTDWRLVHARKLDSITRNPENILFHYDLMRPWGTSMRSYNRDPSLDLFEVAEKISVVTLVCPQNALLDRHDAVVEKGSGANKRHNKLQKNYRRQDFVDRWYRAWFDRLDRYKGKIVNSHVLVSDDDYITVGQDLVHSYVQDNYTDLPIE